MGDTKIRTPWAWIAVTAYATTLAWCLAGDIIGDQSVVSVMSEWQTLIAGLATVSALVYAGRQLQMDRNRDRRTYLLQHTSEWDALEAMEADLDRFKQRRSPVLGALLRRRSGYCALDLDAARWERLNELCVPAIDAPLREFMTAARMFDAQINFVESGTNSGLEEFELSMVQGHLARIIDTEADMREAISRRKQGILALAPVD